MNATCTASNRNSIFPLPVFSRMPASKKDMHVAMHRFHISSGRRAAARTEMGPNRHTVISMT
jgi:hypothetical protein